MRTRMAALAGLALVMAALAGAQAQSEFRMPMIFGSGVSGPARQGNIDPGLRNLLSLVQRGDVRSELEVDARQREALEEISKGGKSGAPPPLRLELHSEGGAPPSPEEIQEKLQGQIGSMLDERNARAEKILRPAQAKRLRELDFQWRGPLAIADKAVADRLALTPEQRSKAQEFYREYRKTQQEKIQEVMREFIQEQVSNDNGDDGTQRKSVTIKARIPDRKEMTPAQRAKFEDCDKAVEETRKKWGEKALALLTPEQVSQWKTLQGRPFTFRIVD